MFRIIQECKPGWVIGENVPGIINMELDQVLSDLESEGYETQTFIIPAAGINAPHKRERVWIIAYSDKDRKMGKGFYRNSNNEERNPSKKIQEREDQFIRVSNTGSTESRGLSNQFREKNTKIGESDSDDTNTKKAECKSSRTPWNRRSGFTNCNSNVANSTGRKSGEQTQSEWWQDISGGTWQRNWYEVAAEFCRIPNGFSNWLYRNRINLKYEKDRITGQSLPYLWKEIQQKKVWENIGGQNKISEKENLFAVLWQYFIRAEGQDNLPFESTEVQETYLQNVWNIKKSGGTPQRREYKKYSDIVPQLSHEIALEAEELSNRYKKNRVDRLKSLGNAIVPQIAYIFFEMIKQIENSA